MSVALTVIVVTVMRDGEGPRHEAPGLKHRHVDREVVSHAVDVGPEVLLPGGQGGAAQQHGAGKPSQANESGSRTGNILKFVHYLCMLKMMLETFALSFFWKYFLSPDRAVMAAILISR